MPAINAKANYKVLHAKSTVGGKHPRGGLALASLVSVAKLVDFKLGQVSYTDFIGISVLPCG